MKIIGEEFEFLIQFLKRIEDRINNLSKNNVAVNNCWLDVNEAAKWLKVSIRTLQKYRDEGMIPYSQIGAKIYFKQVDLNQFIENHMVGIKKGGLS